jgi:hypothetical protein
MKPGKHAPSGVKPPTTPRPNITPGGRVPAPIVTRFAICPSCRYTDGYHAKSCATKLAGKAAFEALKDRYPAAPATPEIYAEFATRERNHEHLQPLMHMPEVKALAEAKIQCAEMFDLVAIYLSDPSVKH